ncbi:TetR/AcrR family transcriptional regulator [Actinomadura decatromicini]|uniref:TetR/AcrR family transcriptional regulator n=1 Tax=Actinomadura decatromicini TaxID=2604572 RepID=A0A5D3FVZ1_9ACTN|nr:TetR/AcrR family transcriptional regulator [Actinomadura decatromicini]TYK52481.1 TetR/AcrR family transcriptional regulator [Actinomadura decatromicini]
MSTPNEQRRSERSRQAILAAALDLCRERGLAKTTVEEIAKRAGVGKQTIYRWWGSKAAVVQEALNERVNTTTDFPDTGDLRADLRTQMVVVAKAFASADFAPYVSLIAAAQEDPEIAASLRKVMIEPRAQACAERLRRGREQGELRADVDVDAVVEMLYAPLYYRLLLRTRPVTSEQVADIIDTAFEGLAPSGRDGTVGR